MQNDISISTVGDISLATGLNRHNLSFDGWISDEVLNFLNADIQIANLECVFYPTDRERPDSFNLCEQESSAKVLSEAGFNVLTLGNNHITDFHDGEGIAHTVDVLTKLGISHCGAGRNISEAQKPAVLDVKGKRIGVFSRLHIDSFSSCHSIIASETKAGVAPLIVNEITEYVDRVRDELNLDIVILAVHWGIQEVHNHMPAIHDAALDIVRSSKVDMILGTHSHCIQGILRDAHKHIFFGQGNFYFYPQETEEGKLYDADQLINRRSVISKLLITAEEQKVDSRVVIQDQYEKVSFESSKVEKKIIDSVFGDWSRRQPFKFSFEYRLRGFSILFGKLLNIKENKHYRTKLLSLLSNPKLLVKELYSVIFKPKHR